MVLADHFPEKWVYREHSKVKHKILEKYLHAWIRILGKTNRLICYFDCFAGRGRYDDGSPGSPLIVLRLASELSNYFNTFIAVFIEKNPINYDNLVKNVNEEIENNKKKYEKIEPIFFNKEFAEVAAEIVEKVGKKLAPSFFFIDPFGFSGVPFDVIRKLMQIPKTEMFLTFMTRDMRRFLDSSRHQKSLDSLFGTTNWREEIMTTNLRSKEDALREYYRKRLHEIGVKYTWPFRVNMPEKRRTAYYLIHATNHFKGMKIMKDIMFNVSRVPGTFAYLGPDEG